MSQPAPVPVVDRSAMRHAMGCWTTGVAVITTADRNGCPHGDDHRLPHLRFPGPGAAAGLPSHGARTAGAVLDAGRFAVSILAAWHKPIARRFANRREDHFAGLPPTTATTSSPVVPGALAHLDRALDRHIDAVTSHRVRRRAVHLPPRRGTPGVLQRPLRRLHQPPSRTRRPVLLNPRSAGGPLTSGHGAS